MQNLATILETSAREYPERDAFVYEAFRLTYQQVNAMANQVAGALVAQGIQPGDKVALCCPNLPFFPICYYGILKAGAAVVPLNVLLTKREVTYHLDNSEAKLAIAFVGSEELPIGQTVHAAVQESEHCKAMWLLTPPGMPSPIEGVPTVMEQMMHHAPIFDTVQMDNNATAVILYTSGTTGNPKGAELTHTNLLFNCMVSRDLMLRDIEPSPKGHETLLIVLPLFHSFGQSAQMNVGVLAGCTMVLVPRFETEKVIELLVNEEITMFAGVPTMYWELMRAAEGGADVSHIRDNLKVCCSGGAAMPVELLKAFEAKFDVPILEGYGLSETSPVATFNRTDRPRKVGSIGLPVWGVQVRVVDEDLSDMPPGEPGEVVIRGHNVMKGYFNNPRANEECFRGGWFHTGDVGTVDEEGYFYIVDRTKDMIIRGGFNVYPREIEEVLVSHPEISLACVIGVPNDEYGEEIKAFVVLNPGSELTPDAIVKWSKEQLAAYKYPRVVEIRPELPLGPTGKILKKELRKQELGDAAKH